MIVRKSTQAGSLALASALLLYAAASAQRPVHPPRKTRSAPIVAAKTDPFARDIAPLIQTYCTGCHGGATPTAGISLASAHTTADILRSRGVWERVGDNVGSSHMPPEGAPKPTQAQRDLLVHWLQATFSKADCSLHDPGRVTMRRLNRAEYDGTVRDLLGFDLRLADQFPADDVGYGFDNIGDVLSISPLLMEKYLKAADRAARAAIITPEQARQPIRFKAEQLPGATPTAFETMTGHLFFSNTELGVDYNFPQAGAYTLRARAFGQQAGPDPAKMAFRMDGKEICTVEVRAEEHDPQVYEAEATVPAGKHHFAVAFVNDYYVAPMNGRPAQDRNLALDYLEIQPSKNLPYVLPPSQRRLIFCRPASPAQRDVCARRILTRFASRAYRRPATTAEVGRLLRYVHLAQQQGESFERGIQLAVQAAMVSPNFLFHVEVDPHPNDPGARHPVNEYELASRLSYFLWSSMPDDTLFALAAKRRLHDPAVLEQQVKRMLRDPRAGALADNFAGQWLQLRNLANVAPDTHRFTDFNDDLRASMRTETQMFFEAVVNEDHSVLDFLDGRFTYLNETLARHYGIPGVQGPQFRRVALDGVQRAGVLTQASILTVTSNPTRTSPVKRGKWVLEQFLGTPPPPPPPGVGVLPDEKREGPLTGTLRQRMEQHRKKPICASCHSRMDPIGFGLENFDAVGAWRTTDGGLPVDASGVLPDGRSFQGPAQLRQILLTKKDLFVRCLTGKLLTYALGRGIESYDNCNLSSMARSAAKRDYRFSAIITSIVQSDPFRMRRGDGGKKQS